MLSQLKLSRISRLCIGVSAALAMSAAVAQPQDVKATLTSLSESKEVKRSWRPGKRSRPDH
ncbi:hypothetical protein [Advenella kashmirensis]|uniref:hypothetical protein n=1 Tax=Advenella kashmirensis TaxID=310575 RepID=UPI0011D1D1D8|nr:hypothetical protein [Advenella kashmirensis]